jgi:hypothetical protein
MGAYPMTDTTYAEARFKGGCETFGQLDIIYKKCDNYYRTNLNIGGIF